MSSVSSSVNFAWFTFAVGVKARRKPKYKARYGRFSGTEWRWLSSFTVVFQSYKRNVFQYRKRFSLLGIIFAWIQKIMIYISDFACSIILSLLNTTVVVYILARYISLRYYWLTVITGLEWCDFFQPHQRHYLFLWKNYVWSHLFSNCKRHNIFFSLAISCGVHSNHYNNSCTLLCVSLF